MSKVVGFGLSAGSKYLGSGLTARHNNQNNKNILKNINLIFFSNKEYLKIYLTTSS
jgi:hypothetical protein